MPIPVREEDRPVGNDRVQVALRRGPAGERVHPPAAAQDPFLVGMRLRVAGDALEALLPGRGPVQVAPDLHEAAARRMQMRILEAGQEHAIAQIDHVRLGPAQCLDLRARTDRCDAPRPNGDRLGPAPGGVHRVDASAREDEIGCSVRGHGATLSDRRPLVQAGTEL